jgi:hypothetical protein
MNYKLIAASIKKSILSRKKLNLIAVYLIAASSAFAQVPSYVPTNGLLGWWPFSGNSNDESGNGNNGMVNGATLASDRNGIVNSAYEFNGSSFISLTDSSFPVANSPRSVSFWIKPTLLNNNYHMVFSYGSYLTNQLFSFGINLQNQFFCSTMGNQLFIQNATSNTNIFVTIVHNQSSYIIYFNGLSIRTGTLPTNTILNKFYIGRDAAGGEFVGVIDDFGIWNRALNQQEITNLFNAQSCTSNTITADGPTTFCAGNFVNLTSDVVGGTYQWRRNGINIATNGTSKTFKATLTGSYTCVATCNGTALTSNAISVTSKTNASASVSASGATSFCAGDSVILNCTNLGSSYSVQWYRTNVSMENATNYSIVVKQLGTYKVVTKNLTNGCSRISGSAITTNVNCRIAGDITSSAVYQENTTVGSRFTDNELSQGVHIYPNPNSGIFSFNYDGEETGDAELQIINNMGQSIYQSRLTVLEGGITQDLQLGDNITKGIYIVRLLINNSYHDSKVIVK